MTLPTSLKDFSRSAVEALSAYKKEPAWMTELRLQAWDVFDQTKATLETSLQPIRPFMEPPQSTVPTRDWPGDLEHALDERGDEEGLIVQRDSTILSRSITKDSTKKGVMFTDMDTALQTVPEKVRPYFGRLAKPADAYTALQTAFWSGGTFLYVPEYYHVALPFHTCAWMSAPEVGIFTRTLIVVEKGSSVSFIDEGVSCDWERPGMAVGITEAFVGSNSRVSYFDLQNWGKSVYHRRRERIQVAPDGRFMSYRMDRGGQQPLNLLALWSSEGEACKLQTKAHFEDIDQLEGIFQHVEIPSVGEKLRYYVEGWQTGHRPHMTLERIAQLHPEVR